MLKETFDFVNSVSKVDLIDGDFIVNFNVESLFTNIPVVETVDIIIKRSYPDNTTSFTKESKERKPRGTPLDLYNKIIFRF